MKKIEELKKIKCGKIIENADLKKYTTFKIEGSIETVVYPTNIEELVDLLKFIKQNNLKYKIIGNGSNLIFVNDKYDGIIIKLDNFNSLQINDNRIVVGSGYDLMKLAYKCCKLGLTGLEFATGIPGTVGGAVFMNAGAYNTDMGYIVSEIKVLTPDLEVKVIYNRDLDFHYRTSFLQKNRDYICLEVTLILRQGNKKEIELLVEDRKQRRMMSQPLEYPSAGSVFRNPINNYAGKLIEEVGLKGEQIGGAKVSEKHANFIINVGNLKGKDVKDLIDKIVLKVKKEKGIELKVEQEIVE